MKDYVNWGIVAPGIIAEKMGEAISVSSKKNHKIKCYGVASRDINKAKNFAQKWGFEKAFGSYDELFSDANVDIVYIASPHSFHYEMIKAALQHGKNVLCEKPATVNSFMLEEVISLAKQKNLFFMEALWTAFNPTFNEILKLVKNGVIGNVLNVKSLFCNRNELDFNHRNFNPNLAGGALLDLGIYNLFFSMAVSSAQNNFLQKSNVFSLDVPNFVSSSARIVNTVDSWNCVNLSFENGVKATFESAMDIPHLSNSHDAYIMGSKGYIYLQDFFMTQNAKVFLYKEIQGESAELFKTVSIPFDVNGYEYEMIEATNCVLQGKTQSSVHPYEATKKLCAIMDYLRKEWGVKYPME